MLAEKSHLLRACFRIFEKKLCASKIYRLNSTSRARLNQPVPSGWGQVEKPSLTSRAIHYLYEKMQYRGSVRPGDYVGEGSLKAKGKHTPEV